MLYYTFKTKKEQNYKKKKDNPKHSQMLQQWSQRGKLVEFKWLNEVSSAYKKTKPWQCLTSASPNVMN